MFDPTDREVPQDLSAERAVLGACLYGARRVDIAAEILSADDFYHGHHRRIFRAMQTMAQRGEEVDTATVAGHLRSAGLLDEVGGIDYLAGLSSSVPMSENARSYAVIVKAAAARRAIIQAAHQVTAAAYEAETAEDAQAAAYDSLSSAIANHATVRDVQVTGADLLETWTERTRVAGRPIPTGIHGLDVALRGGWRRQQVHILTARTGVGKSGLICHFVSAAIDHGVKVGLATLEMPTEEVLARLVAMRTGIPYRDCENGPDNIPSPTDRAIARGDVDKMRDYLVIDEASGYGVSEMRRRLLNLRRHHGCSLVVLDPFNRVQGSGRSDYERKQSVNDELQRLGHPEGLGVPLIVVAQQNREGVGNATLQAIKGCGDLEEDAPVVLALERREEEGADLPDEVDAMVRILKNRGGRSGLRISLVGDASTFAWREVPADSSKKAARPPRSGARPAAVDPDDYEDDPYAD